jgi:endonuclease YncB( thermonuclease family)
LSSFSITGKPDSPPERQGNLEMHSKTNTAHPTAKLETAREHQVLRIIDGDTIQVLIDGKPITVRLLGIDTPETSTKRTGYRECYGKEATEYAKSLLTGKKVRIEPDTTQDSKDKYGRMLAHVFFS